MQTYTAKNGKKQFKPSMEELEYALETNTGYCLACGTESEGVEPDATRYTCECCGAAKVYGSEELLLIFYQG
jgi:hypothetical protein